MIELRHLRTLMALKESGSLAGAAKNVLSLNPHSPTKLRSWSKGLTRLFCA